MTTANRQLPPNNRQWRYRQTANRLYRKAVVVAVNVVNHRQLMNADFSQTIECLGRDLPATIAAARAAGFEAHHMTALPEVVYRLHFWMTNATTGQPDAGAGQLDDATPGKTFKEFLTGPPLARALHSPEAIYNPKPTAPDYT